MPVTENQSIPLLPIIQDTGHRYLQYQSAYPQLWLKIQLSAEQLEFVEFRNGPYIPFPSTLSRIHSLQ